MKAEMATENRHFGQKKNLRGSILKSHRKTTGFRRLTRLAFRTGFVNPPIFTKLFIAPS